MTEYKVLIVDDEKLSRESIRLLLSGLPEWRVVGEATNGKEAKNKIHELQPDLVFLDIEMPHMTGIEVVNELHKHRPIVVFTTAYDNYAVKAFEESAIDYLLKPYTDERFYRTLDRVKSKMLESLSARKLETISRLLHTEVTGSIEAKKTFSASIGDTIFLIDESEILWVSASGNYAEIHTRNKKFFYRETISNLAVLLNPTQFVRINRSYIVRIDEVNHLKKLPSGEYLVILKNGTELKLSRSYRDRVDILLRRQ